MIARDRSVSKMLDPLREKCTSTEEQEGGRLYPARLGSNARLVGEGLDQNLDHFRQLGGEDLGVDLADATKSPGGSVLDQHDGILGVLKEDGNGLSDELGDDVTAGALKDRACTLAPQSLIKFRIVARESVQLERGH